MRRIMDMSERLLLWAHVALWAVAAVVLVLPAIAAAQGVAAMPDNQLRDKLERREDRPLCFRQFIIEDWLIYPDGRKRMLGRMPTIVPCTQT